MRSLRILQRRIGELIRVAMVPYPIDLGKFTVRSLMRILPKIKRELGLDFDKIIIYPGPQPRESADIELYKKDRLVRKISVKTAVSGDLEVTLRKLKKSIKIDEDGLIIIFGIAIKEEKPIETKMLIIYIPSQIIQQYASSEILYIIEEKLIEKVKKEHLDSIDTIALNEALQFEQAYRSIIAQDIAKQARQLAEQARDEARLARELAEQARDEAKQARELAEQARDEARLAKELAEQARDEAKQARELAEQARDEAKQAKNLAKRILEKLDILLSRNH